ncbi:MAG TPA: Mut7-C RNAse domain-containing protein [Thermodesulfovibrionales bacterium]|nr:Mut7-C RNAse domain-containing protein [Thermodesulfovibrionales bacterium]
MGYELELSYEPRFIADAMLGRLARWLRLLGFDTLYYQDIRDGDLLKLAVQEDRFILTKDSHFSKIKGLKNLLIIHYDHSMEQVREVLMSFNIRESRPRRCPCCNGMLVPVHSKETVRDMVPEHVFFDCGNFQSCRTCGKVYWEGSHLKRLRERVDAFWGKDGCGERS